MILTIISSVLTSLSIVCTIVSIFSAKSAKAYKKSTAKYLETLEIKSVIGRYEAERHSFLNQTRNSEWYKGNDPSTIISPMVTVLQSFSAIYPYFNDSTKLKEKIHELDSHIQCYDRANNKVRQRVIDLSFDVLDILNQAVAEKSQIYLRS